MDVLYIDSLFLFNVFIDYLLLLVTGRVRSLELARIRLALGALWGGSYAVLCALSPRFFALATVKLAAGALMAAIAYGGRGRFARTLLVFYAVAAAFGGAAWCAGSLGGFAPGPGRFVPLSLPGLALCFALCYAALTLLFKGSGKRLGRRLRRVCIRVGEREARLTALEDTGKELTDPLDGRPVVVAEAAALAPLLGEAAARRLAGDPAEAIAALAGREDFPVRLRLLCCTGVTGEQGLLLCFRPDAVTVDGSESRASVAVAPRPLAADGSYQALI